MSSVITFPYTPVAALYNHTRLRANTCTQRVHFLVFVNKNEKLNNTVGSCLMTVLPSSPINPINSRSNTKGLSHKNLILELNELLHNYTLQSISPWCYSYIHIRQHTSDYTFQRKVAPNCPRCRVSNLTDAEKLNNT